MNMNTGILMADLAGYTAMTDIHGGVSAARTVQQYLALVNRSLSGRSELVQRIGDQVVITSPDVEDLSNTILTLRDLCIRQHHFLSVHAGIHFGEIHFDNGSLFGSTINVASRLMNLAVRGEVLCSAAFRDHHPEPAGFTFIARGKFRLKNVLRELDVFELQDERVSELVQHHDPVCHMIVDPMRSPFALKYEGTVYHFCSSDCRSIFLNDPGAFIIPS